MVSALPKPMDGPSECNCLYLDRLTEQCVLGGNTVALVAITFTSEIVFRFNLQLLNLFFIFRTLSGNVCVCTYLFKIFMNKKSFIFKLESKHVQK